MGVLTVTRTILSFYSHLFSLRTHIYGNGCYEQRTVVKIALKFFELLKNIHSTHISILQAMFLIAT